MKIVSAIAPFMHDMASSPGAKTAFQVLMAAAVANLTHLAATTSQPTDATSGSFGRLAALSSLLVLLVSRTRGRGWPAQAPDARRLPRITSRGRQLTSRPTALSMPGCRPGF